MALSHSPADILASLLVALIKGTNPDDNADWPIYISSEPNAPDNCITVYDTLGQDDGRSMIDGTLWQHYGFQVRIRATTHMVGHARASLIRDALSLEVIQREVTIGANTYVIQAASRIGQVLYLGKIVPASMRSLFTVNGLLTVRQLT